MSFMTPSAPPIPTPPAPPPEPDMGRARALSEEAMKQQAGRRKGRSATIVAGALGEKTKVQTGTPTLMG